MGRTYMRFREKQLEELNVWSRESRDRGLSRSSLCTTKLSNYLCLLQSSIVRNMIVLTFKNPIGIDGRGTN